jgi:RNA polymerase sigma-70 factor (ECF subfamily)
MSESADDRLVEQVRAHDPQALAALITARRQALLAFIERRLSAMLRRKVEPEDILQEASAEAVRTLAEIDLSQRDPFSWLCHVAERRIVDAHRRFVGSQKRAAQREVALDAADSSRDGLINLLVASMTTPSQAFSRDQRHMRLLAALDELPEDQRTALRLRYLENLPSKKVAQRLGKTDGAVRVMLSRALARLQQQLAESSGEG